jgi:hypothetical protein
MILSIDRSGIGGMRARAADLFRGGVSLVVLRPRISTRTLDKAVASNATPMQMHTAGLRTNLMPSFGLLFTLHGQGKPNCEFLQDLYDLES